MTCTSFYMRKRDQENRAIVLKNVTVYWRDPIIDTVGT